MRQHQSSKVQQQQSQQAAATSAADVTAPVQLKGSGADTKQRLQTQQLLHQQIKQGLRSLAAGADKGG